VIWRIIDKEGFGVCQLLDEYMQTSLREVGVHTGSQKTGEKRWMRDKQGGCNWIAERRLCVPPLEGSRHVTEPHGFPLALSGTSTVKSCS
jgi:hypothetical protein